MTMGFVLLAWGCAGGNGVTDGGPGRGNNDDTEFDEDLCLQIPFFDAFGQDCQSIEGLLDRTIDGARACNVDSDCQVISGQCEQHGWTGRCWAPVNNCPLRVPPPWPDEPPPHGAVDLQYFIDAYADNQCSFEGGPCATCGAPPQVVCLRNECTCLDPLAC